MELIEGVDYRKVKGTWLNPFGRLFETLRPIPRPYGGEIPAGYQWDGGTGVPMKPQAKSMYGFLVHDYTFSQRDMGYFKANWESVRELGRRSIPMAIFIALAYTLLTPILLMYWFTDETKVDNRKLLMMSIAAVAVNLWFFYYLFFIR